MAKLNQIIAIEKGIKSRVYGEITELHKINQKPALFNGFSKQYRPLDAADETLPPENQRVQQRVDDTLRKIELLSTEWYDITARKDWSNCKARADVSVNGKTLLKDVPVTYLLFLEKQLTDLRTFIDELPLLDESDVWVMDPDSGLRRTAEVQTHRTKKMQGRLVLLEPTKEHPGQAQMITEDKLVGYWHQTKLSGAMAKPRRDVIAGRVEALLQAVKQAREAANGVDEEPTVPPVGETIFEFLWEG